MTTTTEMIKQEGGKFVLYSKDGSKVLGRFASKAEAEKHEARVQAFKHMDPKEALGVIGLAQDVQRGCVSICEGGRLPLQEVYIAAMGDDELRAMRDVFVKARQKLMVAQDELPANQRYSSAKGYQLMADVDYYHGLVRMIEVEMTLRMLTL